MHNQELVEQVQAFCLEHYADDFYYSTIIECYTDQELSEELDRLKVRTLAGFRQATAPIRDIYEDRIADARNSAF